MKWLMAWAVAAAALVAPGGAAAQTLMASELVETALQGFGDRYNSHAWGIAWWNDKLYVGTGRATHCVQQAMLNFFNPDVGEYPPVEEDLECTPDAHDLPLQAEIWRWTPETDTWDMLYRSPNDVPIAGTDPVKYTARDIGFRSMHVFREADGTEALYVSGVSSRGNQAGTGFNGPVPPPRILRSTDGVTFAPLPQDPGTVLGDIAVSGFRTMVTYRGRLYVLGSYGLLGHGVVFEAANPEQGNNAFRQISPPGQTFFEIEAYNDHLFLGTGVNPANDPDTVFSLLKTDATGDPYTFSTVIPDGAYKKYGASPAVISMHEFDGRLYVGTDRELLRVNPDDSWELVVGTPRKIPSGRKLQPLSGFDVGFDNIFNIHMWRMTTYRGALLVGTQDQSAKWRNAYGAGVLRPRMGADLYGTTDGWHFTMVTRNGFGDLFNNGIRNFTATPHGLFMGTANHYYGTRVFRTADAAAPVETPRGLWVETRPRAALLSWEGAADAARFHVYRDTAWEDPVLAAVVESSGTGLQTYVDRSVSNNKQYHYQVVAEDSLGRLSAPSTMVPFPFVGPTPTVRTLRNFLRQRQAPASLLEALDPVRDGIRSQRFEPVLAALDALRGQVEVDPAVLPAWQARDFGILLRQFVRRVTLARAGALSVRKLLRKGE